MVANPIDDRKRPYPQKLITVIVVLGALLLIAAPVRADSSVPARQSDCEIRANQFKATHPGVDPFDYLEFGFFYFGGTVPPGPPRTYRDAASGTRFHVGTDGRHITAMDAGGKVLWVRDPFVDRNMCPYRSAHPYISWIGAPGGGFGRHYLGRFKPTPDAAANARIVKELGSEIMHGRKVAHPEDNDRFIGLSFNSSQFGYVNIRNGDFYDMGQD